MNYETRRNYTFSGIYGREACEGVRSDGITSQDLERFVIKRERCTVPVRKVERKFSAENYSVTRKSVAE